MKAKKFIPLLAAAATVTPSIALAHNPLQGIENDLTVCTAAAFSVSLAAALLRRKAEASYARIMLLAAFCFSFTISLLFAGVSVAFFYEDFNGFKLLMLNSIVAVQIFILCRAAEQLAKKIFRKKNDTNAPDQPAVTRE
jgi:hypothetical protein